MHFIFFINIFKYIKVALKELCMMLQHHEDRGGSRGDLDPLFQVIHLHIYSNPFRYISSLCTVANYTVLHVSQCVNYPRFSKIEQNGSIWTVWLQEHVNLSLSDIQLWRTGYIIIQHTSISCKPVLDYGTFSSEYTLNSRRKNKCLYTHFFIRHPIN